jgi:hypothetical protein
MSRTSWLKGWVLATAGTVVTLSGLSSSPAQAAIVFTNGNPSSNAGLISDLCVAGICDPNTAIFNEVGDDFTLSSDSVIQGILWTGAYAFGDGAVADDDFSVRIFDKSNGSPLATPRLEYSNTQVSRSDLGSGLYSYRYDLSTPTTLTAGNYFLSIVNNTPNDDDDWSWAFSTKGAGNPFFRDRLQQSDGSFEVVNWNPLPPEASQELSFAIGGEPTAIPTPALLPGLIGLGLGVFRKRKQQNQKIAPDTAL